MTSLRPVFVLTAALLALTTVVYPATVTAVGHVLFADRAAGSLVIVSGQVRGSSLLGWSFAKPEQHPEYLWGRPSAASVDAATGVIVSGASNLGPTSPALAEAVGARIEALRASGIEGDIPVDLVTASGSGLDPDVSPEGALVQIPRIARARGVNDAVVRSVITAAIAEPTLGVFGARRVNVLAVNLALDAAAPPPMPK